MMRVGFLIYPGCSVMGLAVSSVFEMANLVRGEKAYDIQFISEKGGSVRSSSGLAFETKRMS